MAIRANIIKDDDFFSGEDKILEFTVFQADETTRQDISGWALSWMLKRSRFDTDAGALITVDGVDVTITNGAQGECEVRVSAASTATLSGAFAHELKRMDTNEKTVLSYGDCYISRAVHRA